jgi:hypothetical protein
MRFDKILLFNGKSISQKKDSIKKENREEGRYGKTISKRTF